MGFRNLLVKAGLAVGKAAAKFDPSGIASSLLDAYSKHEEKKQLRGDLEEMIAAGFDKFRDEVKAAMAELKPQLPDEANAQAEAFLSQFQSAAKQAARALGDPSATTVPATVAIDDPEQLAAFLPQRPPRFVVGDSVPGLPSWKLVEPLGAGGFGEVWKAEHPYSGTAAFKFFLDPVARRRFTHTEAANLNEIFRRAPTDGVVKLLNAEPGQDPPWLQFEYIGGGDLSRLPERWKGVPTAERVGQANRVIRTLARTAGHFHGLGVVHRDLKPSNVLLRRVENGYKLVIADFGISKLIPAGGSALPTPANSGAATIRAYTALYASPQQKKFQPADRRDDVYALGVLWYQLLRGDLSLERPSGEGWKRALKALGVSDATVALLNRCWDDEPDERPADGNALLDAIRELDPPAAVQVPVPAASAPPAVTPVSPPAASPRPPEPMLPIREAAPLAPPSVAANESRPPSPALDTLEGKATPVEAAGELTVEEAIRRFEAVGGHRGATAAAGHKLYETAARLRFVPCRCSREDEEYGAHEFVARNVRGTCYYVSHNLRTGKITVGPNGYHACNPDVPECVPGTSRQLSPPPNPVNVQPTIEFSRPSRVLEERDIAPRGTWLVMLSEHQDGPQRTNDDARSVEAEEVDEEGTADDDWQILCFPPTRTDIREGERYCFRLAPRDIRDLDGLDALADLRPLHTIRVAKDADFPASGFKLLCDFRHLQVLDLGGTPFDDDAAELLAGLVSLRELHLYRTRITGSGIAGFTRLVCLETLDLTGTPLRNASFGPLAPLHQLESLWLNETGLTDSDFSSLTALPGLKLLGLASTRITDAGLGSCKRFGKLQALDLDSTTVTDAGLAHLASCGGLNELSLSDTAISDAGLAWLGRLRGLTHLSLSGCGVSDEGLKHLRSLHNLRSLELARTGIGNGGLSSLREMNALSTLSLENCRITDAGLVHLRGLTALETLNLIGTKVTQKGVRELQFALPECYIRK